MLPQSLFRVNLPEQDSAQVFEHTFDLNTFDFPAEAYKAKYSLNVLKNNILI